MKQLNGNLHRAKEAKNDEFYTRMEDIVKELYRYKTQLENKIIYCNCDNPEWSNFWKYFHINFSDLKLKKLIATFYDEENAPYKMEYSGGNDNSVSKGIKTPLKENGDFRSEECIEILKEADIVITNPPFSLFREYIGLLEKHNKKYLVIGNLNAVTYKEVFPLIKEGRLRLGYSELKTFFNNKNGYNKKVKATSCRWFTNLIVKKNRHLGLHKKYNPEDYPKYDNYDAINVDRVCDIPVDYYGVMGVPITFLDYYCPESFDIVAFRKGEDGKDLVFTTEEEIAFNDEVKKKI